MERSRDNILFVMEEKKKMVLFIERKHLPELIEDPFLIFDESLNGLPSLKQDLADWLNASGIFIEYSGSSIIFVNLGEILSQIDSLNVVATVSTDIVDKLDLKNISQSLKGTEYAPNKFPGLILKLEKPSATIMIFSYGKMVITGLKDRKVIKRVVDIVIAILQNMNIIISNPLITIHKIVSTIDLGLKIDLNTVTIVMDSITYNPETFPGLIYRMRNPKVEFWIFSDGKVICLGAKSKDHLKKAIIKLIKTFVELKIFKSKK
ncbi:MAG: TATA-box-binding protein [Candidatus Lokiarchaeota archaeon]|nr:TATA-box-binding protein [Candidatus Lokiarchaeota archaeon]